MWWWFSSRICSWAMHLCIELIMCFQSNCRFEFRMTDCWNLLCVLFTFLLKIICQKIQLRFLQKSVCEQHVWFTLNSEWHGVWICNIIYSKMSIACIWVLFVQVFCFKWIKHTSRCEIRKTELRHTLKDPLSPFLPQTDASFSLVHSFVLGIPFHNQTQTLVVVRPAATFLCKAQKHKNLPSSVQQGHGPIRSLV